MAGRSRSLVYPRKNEKDVCREKYYGIYRDDGFIVFEGTQIKKDTENCINIFQWRVDRVAESDCLQSTMKVWGRDDNLAIKNKKLTYVDEH